MVSNRRVEQTLKHAVFLGVDHSTEKSLFRCEQTGFVAEADDC
jgi:hypothetical protein